MRVLILKTSSLGDVIHTFPALTEASRARPDIEFHWAVEQSFAHIPALHPAVKKVIPVNFRALCKAPSRLFSKAGLRKLMGDLRESEYDLIVDAQGLVKSAVMARMARGKVCGYDKHSAREPLAALLYHQRVSVPWEQHALERIRQLFSQVFEYELPAGPAQYGLDKARLPKPELAAPYCIFFHGTTWETKHWPEAYWCELAKAIAQSGLTVYLPWGNAAEQQRAERIAQVAEGVQVLPKTSLTDMAAVVAHAAGCVAVDTGLGHLTAAFDVPCVSLYGPTNPGLTGAVGAGQYHFQASYDCAPCLKKQCPIAQEQSITPPCFTTVKPEQVLSHFNQLLS